MSKQLLTRLGKSQQELTCREFVLFSLVRAHWDTWEKYVFTNDAAREKHYIWRMQWWHAIQVEFPAELTKHGFV